MAIRPEDEYGSRANAANADYPQGSAKNETTPGANDGTPILDSFLNDTWGFLQALLARANVTPSGNPDTALASDYLDALDLVFGASSLPQWVGATEIATPRVEPWGGESAGAALSGTDLATYHEGEGLQTYRFDGTDWTLVGNVLAAGTGFGSMAALSSDTIAFLEASADVLQAYQFDGTDWTALGNSFAYAVSETGMAALSSTRIAVYSADDETLTAFDFDGTDWTAGGTLVVPRTLGTGRPVVVSLSSTEVALVVPQAAATLIQTFRYDGSSWAAAGAALDIGSANSITATGINGTDIAVTDASTDDLRVYRFDRVTETWAGGPTLYSFAGLSSGYLVAMNGVDLAYLDADGDELTTFRLAFAPSSPYSVAGGAF